MTYQTAPTLWYYDTNGRAHPTVATATKMRAGDYLLDKGEVYRLMQHRHNLLSHQPVALADVPVALRRYCG